MLAYFMIGVGIMSGICALAGIVLLIVWFLEGRRDQ